MSKKEIKPEHHEYHDDEIDIFQIFQVLLDRWKVLLSMGIAGLVIGVIFSLSIAKQYTAESKIKLFKQTLNEMAEDKDTNFHVLKLEDKIFVRKFKEELEKQNNLTDEKLEEVGLGLSPSDDAKKAPGIVFLKAGSNDKDISLVFLDLINKKYCELLKDDLNNFRDIKINELEARKKEYYQRLKEFEQELIKFNSDKILKYECEYQLKSDKELENAFAELKDIVKQRELLEQLLPGLENASAAEICDAFKTTCSDLANINLTSDTKNIQVVSDTDKVWSVVVEYRDKESLLESLKKQLDQAKSLNLSTDKIEKLQSDLNKAEINLNTFAKVTLNQLQARKDLLKKQEQVLLKKIKDIQQFQQGMQSEFIKYNEIKNRYNSIKTNYQLVSDKLTAETDKPQVKYYCETINQPKITKTNFLKRLSVLFIIPLILVGFTAFLLIFVKAYKEHKK